ncbi:MAG: EcsC family protein [Ignavibacteriales bacterium]|nr:EcsC family protein [Ignavibacteriales bacterium]
MENIDYQKMIMTSLDWTYDKAVNGLPGLDSAIEMAESYLKYDRPVAKSVNSLIRWQNTKAATSGFLSGFGGAFTLPVTIPANIASVMYVQTRAIAAIAHMGGFNLKDDQVQSLVYACLAGNSAKDILKEVGIKIGSKLTETMIKRMSVEVVKTINQKVGFRLVTKFGEKGIINLGKAVPVVGGVIGGTVDGISTHIVGKIAKKTFILK